MTGVEVYSPKTVGELREILYHFPDNLQVIMDYALPLQIELIVDTVNTGQLKFPRKFLNFS